MYFFPCYSGLLRTPDNMSKTTSPNVTLTAWCKHHQHSGHDSNNCHAYRKWVKKLWNRRKEVTKEKATPEDPLPVERNSWALEHENTTSKCVSESLIRRIQAYLSSKPKGSSKDKIIIDSGATSHMVPHRSCFRSYTPLLYSAPNSSPSHIRKWCHDPRH